MRSDGYLQQNQYVNDAVTCAQDVARAAGADVDDVRCDSGSSAGEPMRALEPAPVRERLELVPLHVPVVVEWVLVAAAWPAVDEAAVLVLALVNAVLAFALEAEHGPASVKGVWELVEVAGRDGLCSSSNPHLMQLQRPSRCHLRHPLLQHRPDRCLVLCH